MSTETRTTGVDHEVRADLESLMRHLADKTPVDPELSWRVEERADRVMEELRRKHDQIDVDKHLHDIREATLQVRTRRRTLLGLNAAYTVKEINQLQQARRRWTRG